MDESSTLSRQIKQYAKLNCRELLLKLPSEIALFSRQLHADNCRVAEYKRLLAYLEIEAMVEIRQGKCTSEAQRKETLAITLNAMAEAVELQKAIEISEKTRNESLVSLEFAKNTFSALKVDRGARS